MHDLLSALTGWSDRGQAAALATVIDTRGSAPRPPGTRMALGADGSVAGSVTAGCVESELVEVCAEVLRTDRPTVATYGITDGDALKAGLMCGGSIEVFVQRIPPHDAVMATLVRHMGTGAPFALATLVEHPNPKLVGCRALIAAGSVGLAEVVGTLGSVRLDEAVGADALGHLASGNDALLRYGPEGQRRGEGARVFVQSFSTSPRLIVFGAIDFAAALADIGSFLGYNVTVCDARPLFVTAERFPRAHEVVRAQPHRYLRAEADAGRIDGRTAICVLTHDPRFDVPVLVEALRLPAVGYVGAMGSRKTHEDRLARLSEEGVSEEELARLHSPIGLHLGGRTPQETALSIAAEIIKQRWGGSGESLAQSSGPVHPPASLD